MRVCLNHEGAKSKVTRRDALSLKGSLFNHLYNRFTSLYSNIFTILSCEVKISGLIMRIAMVNSVVNSINMAGSRIVICNSRATALAHAALRAETR